MGRSYQEREARAAARAARVKICDLCSLPVRGVPGFTKICPGHTTDRDRSRAAERDVQEYQSRGMTGFGSRGKAQKPSRMKPFGKH
jgi:hypothetical protein